MIVLTVLFLAEKIKKFLSHPVCIFPTHEKFAYCKTSNGSNFGWLIRQMSINQKSGRQTFRRRFVSGSLFVSPCPPECYLQSETKIEPYLRLRENRKTENDQEKRSFFFIFLILKPASKIYIYKILYTVPLPVNWGQ